MTNTRLPGKQKGQITFFIIIGILVLIAFSITLYVGGKMRQRIEVRETQQTTEKLGIQPIQDYITTCLSLATTEGLSLIGKQGGVIYQSQGGTTPDPVPGTFILYTDADRAEQMKVKYLILPPEGNVGTLFFSEPPAYPYPGFPYPPGETTPLFKGYYGQNILPPLYITSAQTGERVSNSIQENLELFIAKKTANCASWKPFEEKGYFITAGNATASLIFAQRQEQFAGEQYISINLTWPVEITTPGGDKALLTNFAIKAPVRLATIYYTIKQIIDSDVTDISYKPQDTGAFTISIVPYGEDSFVEVKDAQSSVANKPFEFWIPRKNRRPALWQIDTTPLSGIKFHVTKDGRGTVVAVQDSVLSFNDPCQEAGVQNPYLIQLNSSDPDEDSTTYAVHLPESTSNEIPPDAVNFAYSITLYAKDRSAHTNDWFDSQEIPIQVTICEER
ncbi:MAG: hypothetical protein QW165_03780 [Candidatus Woesearchaeota archaeon]